MHPFPHIYKVSSSVFPVGHIVLDSPGIPSLATITPPEFDGPGGEWSPETMLVGAVADCFALTFRGIARASGFAWTSLAVECRGRLERPGRVSEFTDFEIRARLTLPEDADQDRARRILARAEETCLITQSLKGETHLDVEIVQQEYATSF
jgi:organic hydroperoxide reductase OsmC/OhrA